MCPPLRIILFCLSLWCKGAVRHRTNRSSWGCSFLLSTNTFGALRAQRSQRSQSSGGGGTDVLSVGSAIKAQPAVPNDGAQWRRRWLCGAPLVRPGNECWQSHCVVNAGWPLGGQGKSCTMMSQVSTCCLQRVRDGLSKVLQLKWKFWELFRWRDYKYNLRLWLWSSLHVQTLIKQCEALITPVLFVFY